MGLPDYRSQFSSVQSLSHVLLFVISWIAACQASLSITNSRTWLKLMSIELVMPSIHLVFCHPLLLLPPTPPSIRVFSSESSLHMRWPKYRSFSFSISPSNEHPGLISFRMDWLDLLAVQGTHQAPLSIGFSKKEYWSGLPCCPSGDFPDPGMEPMSLMSHILAGRCFPLMPPGKPWYLL